jgi:hypothetical protein
VVDLEALAATARKEGWTSGSGDLESIRQQARSLGWVEVAPRRGDPTVSVLRPTEKTAARPNSLSARYGLGQQPLHTDGAHLHRPPDLVVLSAGRPSATPTGLWRATNALPPPPHTALRHGMFLVRNGRDSFYSPALTNSGYRYDPGCMTPCDARAAEVSGYFEQQLVHAAAYEWVGEGQVLVIDNRSVLHARSAVAEDDMDRELMRIAFHLKVVQ